MAERKINKELKLTPEEYMEDRVVYKINLYGKLGDRHRWLYYSSSLISIFCAATVPVLIQSEGYKVHAIVLSLIVTVMVSVEKLFQFRQHWRNYDTIESYLRSEQILFQRRAGIYKDKKDEEALEIFVNRIEDGIKHEREETIEMRTKEIGTKNSV